MSHGPTGPILVGASSWSARTLVHDGDWYPRRTMRAADRIAYYAERFRLVEVDVTARFPPTPELSRQWAERTPAGAVLLRYPWWLKPGATASAMLAEARSRLAGTRLAVELPNPCWLADTEREATLSQLEELGLGLVCADGPDGPGVVAATSDLAVVRLGRRGREGEGDDADSHRYSAAELASWVDPARSLAAGGTEVHVLFANTHRNFAVTNPAEFNRLVNGDAVVGE